MMPDLRFDPSKAVTFDLTQGLVHRDAHHEGTAVTRGGDPAAQPVPQVLVPADALVALASAAGKEATETFARALGSAVGRRIAARLAGNAGASPVEVVVEHLAGELAVGGLGSLTLERWGLAAVLVMDPSPLAAAEPAMLEALVGAAVHEAVGGPTGLVHAVLLHRDGARARIFLGGRAGADSVRAWLSQGVPWGEALVRLHAARGET
jgi:hypothetical protein